MKLAYIVSEFPSLSQTFILSQIAGLLDDGHDVDIYAARPGSGRVRHADVERHRLLARTRYRRDFAEVNGRPRRLARAIAIVARAALRHPALVGRWVAVLRRDGAFHALNQLFAVEPFWRKDYDVIVTHFGPTGNAWLFLKELTRAKYACAFYGYDVTSHVRERGPTVYRELFRRGDLFLALSRHMASQLEALGCDRRQIVIHPLGIDVQCFAPRQALVNSSRPLRLLSVARLVEKKGLADAIEAVGRVVRDGLQVEYTIVGVGPLEDALRGLVQSQGLEGRVTLAGPRRSDEVATLMALADVFLLPSVTATDGDQEGTPTVLLEAQACGIPVLSTWHSGVPEVVLDGQSGFLVPEHNIDALAEKLRFLIEHPDVRRQFGRRGRQIVEERYDIRRLNNSLARIYNNLLCPGQVPPPDHDENTPVTEGASEVAASSAPNVSVILATRNRAESMRETLSLLGKQRTDGRFSYEVVVVDNGSTDATRQTVETLQAAYPVTLRYVYERRTGKPWALNTGVRHARGQVFALIDDDVIPAVNWLAVLWSALVAEGADGVAGRIHPKWDPEPPSWMTQEALHDLNRTGLGLLDHGPARRRSWRGQDCRWVGGNMAIRREAASRIGPHDPQLTRGQDSEYYDRAIAQGLKILYEPAAEVWHRIGADRATPDYLRAWRHRQGRYTAQRIPWKATHLVTIMPVWRWAETVRILWEWVGSLVTRQSWWRRFHAELKVREELGVWAERLRQWTHHWRLAVTGRWRASRAAR